MTTGPDRDGAEQALVDAIIAIEDDDDLAYVISYLLVGLSDDGLASCARFVSIVADAKRIA